MPIDADFQKNRKVTGEENGVKICGETNPPEKLGIRGTIVAVDWDLCNGDEVCISTCPVNVFEMIETPGNPISKSKSNPTNEAECIFCMACEVQCSEEAIKVTEA